MTQSSRDRCRLLLVCFGVGLSLVSCDTGKITVEQKQLPKQNPTTYEFQASLSAVEAAIDEARGENWRETQGVDQRAVLTRMGSGDPFANKISKRPGNETDAYLHYMGNSVGMSPVYAKKEAPLPYYADFQIRLVPLGPASTKVEVLALGSYVKVGTEWHPFARAAIFAEVPPTSIEEYQIISDIGRHLGVTNMPKVITPEPNCPVRKLKVVRRR